jgi:autophagy-related protein 5
MLPRHSYLPIVTDKVRKHFSRFVTAELQENPLWFSCDGVALRWHMPIGVIFDQQQTSVETDDGGLALPWQITVHFDKYPDKEILFCEST